MRTWKMEGPPEIVEGMVMNVMTSCSLRPANRARNPPMAWIPSCELPAMRMTASLTFDTFGPPPGGTATVRSLMRIKYFNPGLGCLVRVKRTYGAAACGNCTRTLALLPERSMFGGHLHPAVAQWLAPDRHPGALRPMLSIRCANL